MKLPFVPDVRDDFAGAGGWEQALRLLGFKGTVVGIEIDEDACATARAAGFMRLCKDVRTLDPHDWIGIKGYIASPPCQTFSQAGSGDGRRALAHLVQAARHVADGMLPTDAVAAVHDQKLDERSVLVLEPIRVVRVTQPQWIALEQVPGVLPIWEAFAEILRGWGYSVRTGKIQSEQYGVPQTRTRAILMAVKGDREVPWPTPTHSAYYPRDKKRLDPGMPRWVTMAEALGMTERPSMTVTGGGSATGGAEPFGNASRQAMLAELGAGRWEMGDVRASNGTVRAEDEPSPTLTASMDNGNFQWRQRSNYSGLERPDAKTAAERGRTTHTLDEPSVTITGRSFQWEHVDFAGAGATSRDTVGQVPRSPVDSPAHTITGKGTAAWTPNGLAPAEMKRTIRVTVQEAAILQTFPADYPWQGNKGAQYQQVGNAVPPLLAAHILAGLIS